MLEIVLNDNLKEFVFVCAECGYIVDSFKACSCGSKHLVLCELIEENPVCIKIAVSSPVMAKTLLHKRIVLGITHVDNNLPVFTLLKASVFKI
mgnify:CR=1 FL=1